MMLMFDFIAPPQKATSRKALAGTTTVINVPSLEAVEVADVSVSPLENDGETCAHRPGSSARTQVWHLGSGPDSSGKPNSKWWPKMNSPFPGHKSKLAPVNCKELVSTGSHVVYQNLIHTYRLLKNHRSLQKHLPKLWGLYSTHNSWAFCTAKDRKMWQQ